MNKFSLGTLMVWKNTNKPAYQKLGNEYFDFWYSLEVDLDKEPKNRYGFKWDDESVFDYYKDIMLFFNP